MVAPNAQTAINDAILAAELAVSLLNGNDDAVAVFNNDFDQVFENARPLKANIAPRARLMDSPRESGETQTDYIVFLPIEIGIEMFISQEFYRDTYQEIWNLWQSSELLTVQTRVGSYNNMIIAEPPHEERPDQFDGITMHLKFRQIQIVGGIDAFDPIDETQSGLTILGYQIPSPYTIIGTALGIATTVQAITSQVR